MFRSIRGTGLGLGTPNWSTMLIHSPNYIPRYNLYFSAGSSRWRRTARGSRGGVSYGHVQNAQLSKAELPQLLVRPLSLAG